MKRILALVVLGVFTLVGPVGVSAQQGDDNGHGKGQKADTATFEAAEGFIASFVALMNARDPAVVNLVAPGDNGANYGSWFFAGSYDEAVNNVAGGAVAEIVLFDTRDVRTHDDGHVSVELTYSGYAQYYDGLYTQRWYLLSQEDGGFIIDDGAARVPRVPDDLRSVEAAVTLSNDGLSISESELAAADVLLLTVENTEPDAFLTTGIYVLPAGTSPQEAQAALFADYQDDGQVQSLLETVIGVTPRPAGTDSVYGYLVEPGTTYYIQQWTIDENRNVIPFEGDAFITTFTIATA